MRSLIIKLTQCKPLWAENAHYCLLQPQPNLQLMPQTQATPTHAYDITKCRIKILLSMAGFLPSL